MLTPYFPAFLLPAFALMQPLLNRLQPAIKPIVIGLIAVAAMSVCALATPLTAAEVPAQVVILFGMLTAGYTAAKAIDTKVSGATVSILGIGLVAALALMGGQALAQDPSGLPPAGSEKHTWISWAFALGYGIIVRIMDRKKKK